MSDGSPRWKKLLRYPLHGWQTFHAWRRIFDSCPAPDIVFVPSVFTHHLLGIVPFLLLFAKQKRCTFLLFFPSAPVRFDEGKVKVALKKDPTARLFPILLRLLKSLVASGKVVLGVETRAMGEALNITSGMKFTYLCHPVEISPRLKPIARDSSILFGCYGPARFEKGSDLLQTAAKMFLASHEAQRAKFAVQWIDDFTDDGGATISRDSELANHPRVQFIGDYFDSSGGYERQLQKTDVMVLPYRESYRYRLSRVVIEAITRGIPVIVSSDTTLAEQALEHGAAIVCGNNSSVSLAAAVLTAVRQFPELLAQAEKKAPLAKEHFSVANFRRLLLGAIAEQTSKPKEGAVASSPALNA